MIINSNSNLYENYFSDNGLIISNKAFSKLICRDNNAFTVIKI